MEGEKSEKELTWRCLVCRSFSRSNIQLRDHVSRHAFNVPVYQCKTCKQYFNDKKSLLSHKRNMHGDSLGQGYTYSSSYICPLCGRRFSKKETCVDHILRHAVMQHECKECGWVFDTSYRLYVHGSFWHRSSRKHHTPKKPNQNTVAVQNSQAFDTGKDMKEDHDVGSDCETTADNSNERIISSKKYRCVWKKCLAVMETYEDLTTHMKVFHGVANRTCPICSRCLMNDERLQYHVQHHFNMMFICLNLYCGQMFETMGTLRTHCWQSHGKRILTIDRLRHTIRRHTAFNGGKSTQRKLKSACPICNRRFYDDYKIQHHVQHHCLLKYRCPQPVCHYMYELYNNLQAHCSLRHGVALGASDVDRCAVTSAETGKQRNKLNNSVQHVETSPKKRNCNICGRFFNSGVDLNNHLKNHQNMQFKCPEESCGYEYEKFNLFYLHCHTKHKVTIRKDEQDLYLIRDRTNGKKTFRCRHKNCPFNMPGAFTKYDELMLHLKTIHEPKDCHCPLCNRHFMSKNDLDRHVQDHLNMKYKCPERSCGWMYKLFPDLYNHCYQKHNTKLKIDQLSGKLVSSEEKETESIMPQPETNSMKCICPMCSRVFKSQKKFYHHIEHHTLMQYKCKCGWEFTDFKALQLHHQEAHKSCLQISRADEPWYRLQRVDSETNTETRRTRSHRRSVEAEEPKQRKYPCLFLNCEAGYEDFNEFERHLRFFHKKISGACALCDRLFGVRLEYRVHLQKHIEGTTWFKCLYDGWMYHDLGSLRKHFRVDHKILKVPDEDDYHVVQDAVLGDDDSTSAFEDSSEIDSDDDNEVEPEKNKVDNSKPVDFQTLARRRSTHIRCAFCNMTFDMDLELEEHACYRDIFITATEVKSSSEKDNETGNGESGMCTVMMHAPPKDMVVNWGGNNSDHDNLDGMSVGVAELKTDTPETPNELSNLQSTAHQRNRNNSNLSEVSSAGPESRNSSLGTLTSSQESSDVIMGSSAIASLFLNQDKKSDISLSGFNGSELGEPNSQVQPLLHVNGFSSLESAK